MLEVRTFEFEGTDAQEVYIRLQEKYWPFPNPCLLIDPERLNDWANGGWQQMPHPCLCEDGVHGCPKHLVYVHAVVDALAESRIRRAVLRFIAPNLLVLVRATVSFPRRWIPASVSIIALEVDVRIGEVPKFLLARGVNNQRPP
ncbi:MAG: hypothetical protein HYT49_01680 [Candidatus Wildermuthbacteria bacterium]|nr:hypothetical protein [Candidatus Wildermuthbacteria bacterium]